ncbi:hypothetical protein GKC32_10775 (plasmid) [Lactobacillus curvatus]|nr:hypothetical protein [Latilactobacillus curvatus]MSD84721.1 hypothetical protein [Latilactobacillus curvatus]MSE23457.1 hypothetical protein [Latilactobacillus curvatus]MSE24921.1 hypothetical protein [Latilactobacillus curvatus]
MEFILKVKFDNKDIVVSYNGQLQSTNPKFISWLNETIKKHIPVVTRLPDGFDFNHDEYTVDNYYHAINSLFENVEILQPLIEEDVADYIF